MENIISQEQFYSAWVSICKKNETRILNLWYKPEGASEYTDLILKGKDSITSQIAKLLMLELKHEYYSVDAIFYRNIDLVKEKSKNGSWDKTDGGLWLTRFVITLEHENVPFGKSGAYQEICHLLTINSELKVLVTYQGKDKILKLVEDLNDVIPKDKKDKTPILLIVGYEEENKIIWSAYSLNGLSYKIINLV